MSLRGGGISSYAADITVSEGHQSITENKTVDKVTVENKSTLSIGDNGSLTVNGTTTVKGDSKINVSDNQLTTNGDVTLVGAGSDVPYEKTTNTIDLGGGTWTHNDGKVTADQGAVIEAARNSKANINNANLSLDNGSFVELLQSEMTLNNTKATLTNGASMKLWGTDDEQGGTNKGSVVTLENGSTLTTDSQSSLTVAEGSILRVNGSSSKLETNSAVTLTGTGPNVAYDDTANTIDLNEGGTWTHKNGNITLDNSAVIEAARGSNVEFTKTNLSLNNNSFVELMGSDMTLTDSTVSMKNGSSIKVLTNDEKGANTGSNITLKNGTLTMDAGSYITIDKGGTLNINGNILTVNNGAELHVSSSDISTVSRETATAPISVTNNGKLIFKSGSATYTTADANNNIQTVATADKNSSITVESNAGLYVDNVKVADNTKKYDISKAVVQTKADGTQENKGWDGRVFGSSQRIELNKEGIFEYKGFDTYTGLFAANAMQAAVDGNGKAADFISSVESKYQSGDTAADNANITYALNSSAGLTGLAGVGYGLASFSDTLSRSVNTHDAADGNVWASYIHDKRTVDGLKVGNLSADYDLTYNGAVIGVDFGNSDTTRYGLALAYANGDISTNGGLVSTQNDADYYGGSLYGVWNGSKGLTYKAELGYTKSSNDLTQYNTGTKITASTDADAVYAGVRAEKAIASASGTWTPYAGLRYTRLAVDDYKDSLGFAHNSDNAGIWNLPVGVAYRHESKSSSGWTYTPSVELGYQFAFGNKTMDETVSFGDGSDLFGVDIAENSFLGRLSFTASNDDLAFGVHYGYQKGSNTDSKAWGVSASLKF